MKTPLILAVMLLGLTACNKPSSPTSAAAGSSPAKSSDPVQQKLQDYSGSGATDCGRLDVRASSDQFKTAGDCAMQASQGKHAFLVVYTMPGMSVGVAGDSSGKLYTAQSQGSGAVTAGDCPSQLRVASSGRVTCFAPGDMGSMSGSHTAGSVPSGTANPHSNPHAASPPK